MKHASYVRFLIDCFDLLSDAASCDKFGNNHKFIRTHHVVDASEYILVLEHFNCV